MKKPLSAPQLRLILVIALVLLLSLGIGLFFYGYNFLKGVATTASEVATEANNSSQTLQNLVRTQRDLAEYSDTVNRASLIAAESRSYEYQDQIISDLNSYASRAGVTITDITFTASTGAATPAPAAGTAGPGGVPSTTTASNIKSTTATVTLKSPISYDSMIAFMYSIEQSLTKMRISTIGLSRSTDDNAPPGSVTSDALTIEVYLR